MYADVVPGMSGAGVYSTDGCLIGLIAGGKVILVPDLDDIESQAGNLSVSKDKLGNVRHRHIILSIDVLRSVYWKVPYPVEKEINVTKYLID